MTDKTRVILKETPRVVKDLRKQVEFYEGPSDGTVVRFLYTFEEDRWVEGDVEDARKYYTYVAVWVAGCWNLSGADSSRVARSQSNLQFMQFLADANVSRVEVATEFEVFKP